jgi:hypothetical protein
MCDMLRVEYIMIMEPLTPHFVVDVRDARGTTNNSQCRPASAW